jgi:hypothetical protein
MNAVVQTLQPTGALVASGGRMAVAEVIGHVTQVQEVMRAVMKPDVHYGKIPGTPKPTLLKPGAEVLCVSFRIADEYAVEDLSTPDMIRYRVTCTGKHQISSVVLGSGMGEASSSEEKYKWRKAVNHDEWEETPPAMRRKKHARGKGGDSYVQEQVRTEPADLANTVLKMANKRAKVAMVLNVTAASDMFSQDLEDMEDALRDHLTRHGGDIAGQEQQQAEREVWPDEAFDKQLPKMLKAIADGKSPEEIIAWAESKGALTEQQKARIHGGKKAAADTAAVPTFAQVASAIAKASSLEKLALAGDLIRQVPDEQQRKELQATYDAREAEFTPKD